MKINDLIYFKDKDSLVLGFIEQVYTSKFGFVTEYVIKSILELEGYNKLTYNPKKVYTSHNCLGINNFAYDFIKLTKDKKLLENNLQELSKDYPKLKNKLEELINE